ncbi:MAG TPA: hypothetical protein VH575_11705 [Gemmataceae bacterium]|jgi:predicted  nucleic acid-binding Zn-ribbon protein
MARKSDGEKIDELMITVATLEERINRIDDKVQGLKHEIQELKQDLRESRQRLWLLVPPLVAAFLSAALMAVVNYLLPRH